jgi:uncharacterized membrane protein
MSNLWKTTKCNANDAALSGLSLPKNASQQTIVRAVEQNQPSQSSTMARRVFHITGLLTVRIGLWLMASCIFLVAVVAVIPIALGLIMWLVTNKMSVATDKLKRTLKG